MLTDEQRERYGLLCERQYAGAITEEERDELASLVRQIGDAEAAYLGPANERSEGEIVELTARVERLEDQNRRLREYLGERQSFLARARRLVAQLHAEDQRIRERYRDALVTAGGRGAGENP